MKQKSNTLMIHAFAQIKHPYDTGICSTYCLYLCRDEFVQQTNVDDAISRRLFELGHTTSDIQRLENQIPLAASKRNIMSYENETGREGRLMAVAAATAAAAAVEAARQKQSIAATTLDETEKNADNQPQCSLAEA